MTEHHFGDGPLREQYQDFSALLTKIRMLERQNEKKAVYQSPNSDHASARSKQRGYKTKSSSEVYLKQEGGVHLGEENGIVYLYVESGKEDKAKAAKNKKQFENKIEQLMKHAAVDEHDKHSWVVHRLTDDNLVGAIQLDPLRKSLSRHVLLRALLEAAHDSHIIGEHAYLQAAKKINQREACEINEAFSEVRSTGDRTITDR